MQEKPGPCTPEQAGEYKASSTPPKTEINQTKVQKVAWLSRNTFFVTVYNVPITMHFLFYCAAHIWSNFHQLTLKAKTSETAKKNSKFQNFPYLPPPLPPLPPNITHKNHITKSYFLYYLSIIQAFNYSIMLAGQRRLCAHCSCALMHIPFILWASE